MVKDIVRNKIKCGDFVIVKTWKEMEGEYGLNSHGNIKQPWGNKSFTKRLEEIISKIPERKIEIHDFMFYQPYFKRDDGKPEIMPTWMLKPTKEAEEKIIEKEVERMKFL